MRSCALSSGITEGTAESWLTPSPTSSAAAPGSEESPPQTDTERWALERRRDFDHQVAALLAAAAADGEVRADVEVRLATRLVFGMVNSIVEWYRPDGRGMNEREVAETVVRLVFGGLRKAG